LTPIFILASQGDVLSSNLQRDMTAFSPPIHCSSSLIRNSKTSAVDPASFRLYSIQTALSGTQGRHRPQSRM